MKITRTITYEGPEEVLMAHMDRCLADGSHDYIDQLKINVVSEPALDPEIGIHRLFGPVNGPIDRDDEFPEAPHTPEFVPIGKCHGCGSDVYELGGFCGVCQPNML